MNPTQRQKKIHKLWPNPTQPNPIHEWSSPPHRRCGGDDHSWMRRLRISLSLSIRMLFHFVVREIHICYLFTRYHVLLSSMPVTYRGLKSPSIIGCRCMAYRSGGCQGSGDWRANCGPQIGGNLRSLSNSILVKWMKMRDNTKNSPPTLICQHRCNTMQCDRPTTS